MSRIARMPIDLPADVGVSIGEGVISISGPMGTLRMDIHDAVYVEQVEQRVVCSPNDQVKNAMAQTGTTRSLVANMVIGVTSGFEKQLQLVGVGYRAQCENGEIKLALGFSHPVIYLIPSDVDVDTPSPTRIVVKGMDKQRVGQVAAEIRAYRPPEPYKGKGVRYVDEFVVRKETKKKQ